MPPELYEEFLEKPGPHIGGGATCNNYLDRVVVLLRFLSVIFLHFYHFNQALNILYCENGLHEILKTLKKWGCRRRCISRFGDSNENCHKMDQSGPRTSILQSRWLCNGEHRIWSDWTLLIVFNFIIT